MRGNILWDCVKGIFSMIASFLISHWGIFKNMALAKDAPLWIQFIVFLIMGSLVYIFITAIWFLIKQKNDQSSPVLQKTEKEQLAERVNEIARRNFPEIFEKVVTIHSAMWRPHEGDAKDVTEIVKSYVANGKLEMRCTIDVLGDPRPNIGKVLTIEYWYDGKSRKALFEESRIARLP